MFAVVILGYIRNFHSFFRRSYWAKAKKLKTDIQEGIDEFAYTKNKNGEKIYAYEVDGLRNTT